VVGTLASINEVNQRPARLVLRQVTVTERIHFPVQDIYFGMQPTSHPRPTQPSIPSGSVNEYKLRLGRQRQVWFIPLADERGVCTVQVKLRSLENACHTERLRGVFMTRRYTNTRLPYLAKCLLSGV